MWERLSQKGARGNCKNSIMWYELLFVDWVVARGSSYSNHPRLSQKFSSIYRLEDVCPLICRSSTFWENVLWRFFSLHAFPTQRIICCCVLSGYPWPSEIVPFQPNVMSCKQTMKLMLWLIITCTFSSRTYPETPRIKTVSIRLIATTCRLKVVICTTRWQTSRCSTHAPGSTTSCSLSVNFF